MKMLFKISTFSILMSCNNLTAQPEEAAVKEILASYKAGVEFLSPEGLADLFLKDCQIFESGNSEGTFDHYLDHHLGPELKEFKSFKFSDYKVSVTVDLPYAFTTETYSFRIELPEDGNVIERKGVATSVLKKVDNQWKVMKMHSSSRAKN